MLRLPGLDAKHALSLSNGSMTLLMWHSIEDTGIVLLDDSHGSSVDETPNYCKHCGALTEFIKETSVELCNTLKV